jgi:transposase
MSGLAHAASLATARQIVASDQGVQSELIRKRLDRLAELDTEIRALERRLRALVTDLGTTELIHKPPEKSGPERV